MHDLLNPSTIPTRHFFPLALLLIGISGCDGGGGAFAPLFNVPPVASNSCNAIMDFDTAIVVPLPASDSNGNSTIASYTIDTMPANGSINGCTTVPCTQQCATVAQCASFTYSPNQISNLRGMDKFDFHVTDAGGLASSMATVWILNNGKVRIMPLGDSITAGISGNIPPDQYVGYRRKLFKDLENLNPISRINFVGSRTTEGASAWPDTDTPVDRDQEGHDGWEDGEILIGTSDPSKQASCAPLAPNCKIDDWLNNTPADIILLHIGTNGKNVVGADISATNVAGILDRIDAWENTNGMPIQVFVAQIISSTDLTTVQNINQFNSNVFNMVQSRIINNGDKLFWVTRATLNYVIGAADNLPTGPDMADQFHPNQDGYNKMADKWFADLVASGILPNCQ